MTEWNELDPSQSFPIGYPEDYKPVLVWAPGSCITIAFYDPKEREWNESETLNVIAVSHWAYLPDAPLYHKDGWIPCSERFPEDGQQVIVKGHFPFEIKCIFKTTSFGFEFEKASPLPFVKYYFYGVTHWRPIDE